MEDIYFPNILNFYIKKVFDIPCFSGCRNDVDAIKSLPSQGFVF